MKYLVIFFFSFWGFFTQSPDPKISLTGVVKDLSLKKPLPGCKVTVSYASGSTFETVTNSKGHYKLQLKPGSFTVNYSLTNYHLAKFNKYYNPTADTAVVMDVDLVKIKVYKKDSSYNIKIRSDERKGTKEKKLSKDVESKPRSRGGHSYGSTPSYSAPTGAGLDDKVLTRGISFEGLSAGESSGERATYSSAGLRTNFKAGTLTAGEINDFSKWNLWEDLSKTELGQYVHFWKIAPKHRFSVLITNESKSPLTDIKVVLKDPAGLVIWQGHTDNTGKAELWANLYDSTDLIKENYSIEASYNGKSYLIKKATAFSLGMNKLVIPAACSQPLNMDIVFAVDATGSMGDEIRYLQAELYDVIEKVKQGNPSLDLTMGSVFYRDKEDSYLTVKQDLTSDISKVMDFIKTQSAEGGGDEPEGVDAAMEVAIGQFNWREEARARVMFLVLDASPHHDKESMDKLEKYTKIAAEKGIRIVPVVCSGIDKAGEYLMRSMALATNGNYIFLTDHSGIGDSHITPTTDKFDVETLNVLLIRLLQQYIFMPECNQTVNTAQLDSLQNNSPDSTINDSAFVNNPNPAKDSTGQVDNRPDDWFLKYYPNPCRGLLKVEINAPISELYIADINGKLLMKISVASDEHYKEIDLTNYPAGVYFLRYCVEGKCKSGKFVLVH